MKRCNKCRLDLPIEAFGIRRREFDGRNPRCRSCRAAEANAIYHRQRERALRACSLCDELKPVSEFVLYRDDCQACRLSVQRCTRCREVKPLDEFTPDRRRQPSGRKSACKVCLAHVGRLPRARSLDRMASKARHRKARRNARIRERRRSDQTYRPGLGRGTLSVGLAELARRSGWVCYLCHLRLPADLEAVEVDHVIARSRGGTNDVENLRATHRTCNRRKQALTVEEFQERSGRLALL